LLSEKDKVWQKCEEGTLTLDKAQLKKVTDSKEHLRIGGATEAQAAPGPFDRDSSIRSPMVEQLKDGTLSMKRLAQQKLPNVIKSLKR
jgi:hypothetical protein